MSDEGSLAGILHKLEAGDEKAAAELFQRFAGQLVNLARSRLNPRERRKVDPEDVVQSVFRSFFVRNARGDFEFTNWNSLWGLLVRMTMWKCGRHVDNLRAACRDCRREVSAGTESDASFSPWDAVTRQPTPDEIVTLHETVEQLMRGLNDVEREILSMRLQGFPNREIAQTVGKISERKVFRVLAQVRKRLEQMQEDDASSA